MRTCTHASAHTHTDLFSPKTQNSPFSFNTTLRRDAPSFRFTCPRPNVHACVCALCQDQQSRAVRNSQEQWGPGRRACLSRNFQACSTQFALRRDKRTHIRIRNSDKGVVRDIFESQSKVILAHRHHLSPQCAPPMHVRASAYTNAQVTTSRRTCRLPTMMHTCMYARTLAQNAPAPSVHTVHGRVIVY